MKLVYKDNSLLIVDKPSGLATQPSPGTTDSLLKRMQGKYHYVGLHHRLDQVASGLVLFTLDPRVNAAIAEGFRDHSIQRTYWAVLDGDLMAATTWDRPIEGRAARTEVKPLGHGQGMTAAELRLHTGRTHQIRIHAALAGRPVVGDRRHGGDAGRRWPRLALHAARLALVHPMTGADLVFESPIPEDLATLWAQAGAR